MKNVKVKKEQLTYIIVLIFMIICSFLFWNSFYWDSKGINKRKIVEWILIFLMVIVIPVLSVRVRFLYNIVESIIRKIGNAINYVVNNIKKSVIYLGVNLAGTLLTYVTARLIHKIILQNELNMHQYFVYLAVVLVFINAYFVRNIVKEKPEIFFSIVAIIIGTCFIWITPSQTGVSWDDQIHYERTLFLTNYLNGIMYDADDTIIAQTYNGGPSFSQEDQLPFYQALNESYSNHEIRPYVAGTLNIWIISYIPCAVGIIVGRGLGLPFVTVFMLGKFFNLFVYVFIFSLAIKKVKYGKVLLATIGLIPTSIFQACAYSYDSWVIAFIVLGYAYLFATLQEENKTTTTRERIVMVLAVAIGCVPKAIYFPLLFPFLFIPKRKFESKESRNRFIIGIFVAGLILVATFILPMLIKGPGIGDTRGGSDVNATEQIKFILSQPMQYAYILLNYLRDYLSLNSAEGYLQHYAYIGIGEFGALTIATLAVVAYTDRLGIRSKTNWIIFSCLTGIIACIILVPTALYIDFSPVKADTIYGCQHRYLLPLIFPFLYILGNDNNIKGNKKFISMISPMLIMAITFLINIYMLWVIKY